MMARRSLPTTAPKKFGIAGERRRHRQGLVAPNHARTRAQNNADADGQNHDRELGLADDAANDGRIQQKSEHRHHDHCRRQADPKIETHADNEGPGDEGADDHHLSLGEVHHLGCLVNQYKPERDEPVYAALANSDN